MPPSGVEEVRLRRRRWWRLCLACVLRVCDVCSGMRAPSIIRVCVCLSVRVRAAHEQHHAYRRAFTGEEKFPVARACVHGTQRHQASAVPRRVPWLNHITARAVARARLSKRDALSSLAERGRVFCWGWCWWARRIQSGLMMMGGLGGEWDIWFESCCMCEYVRNILRVCKLMVVVVVLVAHTNRKGVRCCDSCELRGRFSILCWDVLCAQN